MGSSSARYGQRMISAECSRPKAFDTLPLYSERFLSVPPRSRLADQSGGGQPPHHSVQGLQPVWRDDHPDG
jgi:hypothetical protein